MLIRIVRMTFQEDKVGVFLENFHANKEKIRHFEGCRHLELLRDYDQGNVFVTYSHWEAKDALENYRHSDLFKSVWAKTKPLFKERAVAFSVKQFLRID